MIFFYHKAHKEIHKGHKEFHFVAFVYLNFVHFVVKAQD